MCRVNYLNISLLWERTDFYLQHIAYATGGNNSKLVYEPSHSKLDANNWNTEMYQVSYQLQNSKKPNIKIDLVSPHYIRRLTGQYIKVRGLYN